MKKQGEKQKGDTKEKEWFRTKKVAEIVQYACAHTQARLLRVAQYLYFLCPLYTATYTVIARHMCGTEEEC